MVLGHVVAPVDQVVGHHVDHVDGLCDLGAVFFGVGDHVAAFAGGCDGEELVLGEGLADGREKFGEFVDFAGFFGVGDLFVVLAVAAGVFPVDVCFLAMSCSVTIASRLLHQARG